MIELESTAFPCKAVHSIGYEPLKSGIRGNIHVQFHKDGKFTSRGYFSNVQRSIFFGLRDSPKPVKFITQNLKEHFTWVRTDGAVDEPEEYKITPDVLARFPSEIYYPADLPNTLEAFIECFTSQLLQPAGALF